MEEEPEMNAQYIRGYEVTYAGFKVLSLHDLKGTQKNTTKLCARLCFHEIIKMMP